MKKIIAFCFFVNTALIAQNRVNNYKYIIIPNHFGFLKKANQYQTSSLTKFLFNKYGFTAFLDNEKLPEDVARNRCLALTVNMKKKSSLFYTKNTIELKDCYNKVVFTSREGKSKLKEYKKAYHEAIRKAFKSIQQLNYSYKEEKSISKGIPTIEEKGLAEKNIEKESIATISTAKEVLYAQAKGNGFQLINTKPEVVFQILKTGKPNLYLLKGKKGVLYRENGNWLVEYYENNRLIRLTTYQIKF
ncbi:hypothetical protein [Tenacibaculum maritimum]|uniref:Uncharacterized protein n=1 Tax=Tenacibaculum maritimum NCIMB 2154 TaxID=1349785 RepID=A0A2H1ECK3_9FLAO|nr:hypothetical protein [Tenacibaculum maritimum]SFZ83944.1 conserved protein of unknown function [Tenacibaculum maritimum NCIMB 2154]